jgi:4-amino-4-deoxy-L-arabinose transferase-like glycosyltransferase
MTNANAAVVTRPLDRFDAGSLLALALTFALVIAAPFGPKAFGDREFHKQAKRVAAAVKGAGPWSDVEIHRAPGPVIFYAPAYLTVPTDAPEKRFWQAGVAWTAIWMGVALVLTRRIAGFLGGERAGRLAVIISLLSPFAVYYSLGIIAEGPAYVAIALFLFGWVAMEAPVRKRWPPCAMGIGLTLLMLCRPNAALIPPLAVCAWLAVRDDRRVRASALVAVAALVAFVGIGALLSAVQNRAGASPQADYFWTTTLQGRYQYRTEIWDWRFWDSAQRTGSKDFEAFAARDSEIRRAAEEAGAPTQVRMREFVLGDTVEHPFLTARMALMRVLTMHLSFVNSKPPAAFAVGPLPGAFVYWTFHALVNLVGLSIVALALSYLVTQRHGFWTLWPLWAPWLALVIFHSLVYAEPRYLLPAKMSQVVMAACALSVFLRQRRPHPAFEGTA